MALDLPLNYVAASNANVKKPLYILEILWSDGSHGVEGVNDIYFATGDISGVLNFPYPNRYYPLLDTSNLSAVTQKLDPINGISTIGSMTFSLVDSQGVVTEIIGAADAAGHGLRRQRVEFYLLYAGMDWADRVKVRTLQVSDLQFDHVKGLYRVVCSDIQDRLKKKVFAPASTFITSNVADAVVTTINVHDASVFTMITNANEAGTGIDSPASYAKIESEIVKITAVTINPAPNTPDTLTVIRGALASTAAAHTIPTGKSMSVDEVVVLRGNPIVLALNTLISGAAGLVTQTGLPQSPHPYSNNYDNTQTFTLAGSVGQRVSFDNRTQVEESPYAHIYDHIYIMDGDGAVVGDYFGNQLAGATIDIPAAAIKKDTFSIRLTSDFSNTFWGYGVTMVSDLSQPATNVSVYDQYPPTWGLALDPTTVPAEVVQGDWEKLGEQAVGLDVTATYPIASGVQFEFIMDKGIVAKKFIEEQLLKIIGGFLKVTGDGALSARGYADLYQSQIHVTGIVQSLSLTVADCISWTSLDYHYQKMANEILMEFDEHIPLSGKLKRATLLLDATARTKWGSSKPLSYKSFGLVPFKRDIAPIFMRLVAVLARLANPPLSIKVTLPSKWHNLEVGDVVRLTLPIRDLSRSPVTDLDRAFEIISTSFNEVTGNVVLDLEAQPNKTDVQSLQLKFFPQDAQRSVSSAYTVGTMLGAAGAYTIPNGTSIGTINTVSTYYHSGGNLTLLAGQTLNISGSVIIYVDGTFDIQGAINGLGTGASGAAQGSNGNPSGWPYGAAPANSGYVGKGGTGETVGASGNQGYGAVRTQAARHQTAPIVSPVIQTTTLLAGIPSEGLWGGGGGTGGYDLMAGGNGGAGLVIICRGIKMSSTTTDIDLRGTGGSSGIGAGGGGGGGSLLVAVEDQAGIGVDYIVYDTAVKTTGGGGGVNGFIGYGYYAADPHGAETGGAGSFVAVRF